VYYRRKIILALLQLLEGKLDKIKLQKLLFLFTRMQTKADYDFIPYKYGCYSQSAAADMDTMVAKGFLRDGDSYFLSLDKKDYFKQLKPDDQKNLCEVKANYGKMSADGLMRHVYRNYPFYAINSITAPNLLNKEELDNVAKARPKGKGTTLFTIGYEGVSLEQYLVRLLERDVKVLVDVRNNPLSMKYGFSKSQLKKQCEKLGIAYVHFAEVGIQSDQRQELNTQSDYDNLFSEYRKRNLSKTIKAQNAILDLLKLNERIALTCFEANIYQCHRKHLAEAIEQLPGFNYEVKHI
jgi:uncharacterized protein (DUF488 family)